MVGGKIGFYMQSVRLVMQSKAVGDWIEDDSNLKEMVAYCARVSNPSNQENHKTSDRLINYLIKHKHWSPFEMVNLVLEIDTTRDIARQILRHRSFTFQEFSQRYANPEDLGEDLVVRELRLQDTKNRQNSISVDENFDSNVLHIWKEEQQKLYTDARELYKWATDNGVAKEVARSVLPEGLCKSRLYVNGTLRSWIHFIEVRSGPETQKEHREIAVLCAKAISEAFDHKILKEKFEPPSVIPEKPKSFYARISENIFSRIKNKK